MVVCPSGDEPYVRVLKHLCHCSRVLYDLRGIPFEGGLHRLAKSDRFCSDVVHVWATLQTREDASVDERGQILYRLFRRFQRTRHNAFGEDHTAAGAAKGLVSRRRSYVESITEWILRDFAGDKPGDVRIVGHRDGPDLFRDVGDLLPIQFARIAGESSEYYLWFFFLCDLAHFIIVDLSCLDILHFVADEAIQFGHIGDRRTMRKVATMPQIHTEDSVARVEPGKIRPNVGVCATQRLDVRMVTTKNLFRAVDCELLHLVGEFLPTVIALAGVAF